MDYKSCFRPIITLCFHLDFCKGIKMMLVTAIRRDSAGPRDEVMYGKRGVGDEEITRKVKITNHKTCSGIL